MYYSPQGAISDQQDEFQQLVLSVIQREVIPGVKALQENFIFSCPLYSVIRVIVTTLSQDHSWLQSLSLKQEFHWGIIASCCEKIPITGKHFEWVHLFKSVVMRLCHVYSSYCHGKGLPEDKCLLSAKNFPQEITHSEHIKKYELTKCTVSIPYWCTCR